MWQAWVSEGWRRTEQDPSLLLKHPTLSFLGIYKSLYCPPNNSKCVFQDRGDYWRFWSWQPRLVCARHCGALRTGMQDTCSPFSPPLVVEVLMGNLVWENSDKWPVCGEGIRKKGRGEKREDNREGMLILEEHFKEEADHVTAMGNTTWIFHKNKGNQHYDSPHSLIPPVSDKEAVRVRAGSASVSLGWSQVFCSPCDLTYLGNEDISPRRSLHSAAYHVRWLFSYVHLENRV